MFVRRQIGCRHRQRCAGRTKVYGGIVILHRLRNGEPELAAILRRRNSAPFIAID